MKILFVASGNKKFGINYFVNTKAAALKNAGEDMIVFPVKGRAAKIISCT